MEDRLWRQALRVAEKRDDVLAEVIRGDLARYVERNWDLIKDESFDEDE